jgi:hypothetical protein
VREVAPVTTRRHRDRVVLYVMYLYRKMMIMYYCEDYELYKKLLYFSVNRGTYDTIYSTIFIG